MRNPNDGKAGAHALLARRDGLFGKAQVCRNLLRHAQSVDAEWKTGRLLFEMWLDVRFFSRSLASEKFDNKNERE